MLPELAVFDVDGTLVTFDGQSSQRTRRAIAWLRANGVPTAIATGRPMAALGETLDKIGPVDLAVLANGGMAVDLRTDTVLYESTVPGTEVERLVSGVRADLPGVGLTLDVGPRTIEEVGFGRRLPPRVDFEPAVDDALASAGSPIPDAQRVIFFHDDFDDDLAALASIVRPHLGGVGQLFFAPMLSIVEVAPAGDNKATALQVVADGLGVDPAASLVFGDGTNDIEMFEWAGTAVAMGSAGDSLRSVADHVTGTVEADGVADYIDSLMAPN